MPDVFSSLADLMSESSHVEPETPKILRTMRDVQQWIDLVTEELDKRVKQDLIDRHMLVPDIETIDAHVSRTSDELFNASRTWARLERLRWEAEKNIQRVTRKAKRDLANVRANVMNYYGSDNFVYSGKKTVAALDCLVDQDRNVLQAEQEYEDKIFEAEQHYAEALEHAEGFKALVDSLKLKGDLLMGLQGTKNRSMPSYNNRM